MTALLSGAEYVQYTVIVCVDDDGGAVVEESMSFVVSSWGSDVPVAGEVLVLDPGDGPVLRLVVVQVCHRFCRVPRRHTVEVLCEPDGEVDAAIVLAALEEWPPDWVAGLAMAETTGGPVLESIDVKEWWE